MGAQNNFAVSPGRVIDIAADVRSGVVRQLMWCRCIGGLGK
jgi:hypothetical protein